MGLQKKLSLMSLENVIPSLVTRSGQLQQKVSELNEILDNAYLYNQLVKVFSHYNLGELTEAWEIFGGFVNRSFGVHTIKENQKHRYFVRMYKPGIIESEIELEHSLIDFSIANGLTIAAGLIRTNEQKTFVKFSQQSEYGMFDQFFAVYDFLPGEDKYTWDDPTLNDEEYASAAEVLATFHNAAKDFDPRGRTRVEPKIMELLPMLSGLFREFAERDENTKFHKCFLKNIDEIIEALEGTRIPKEDLETLLQNPIHSDFHPGNLKFANNKVVGIFDFDWSKIDLRIFDVSLAMVYACSSWQEDQDGNLRIDKCKIFLESYQNTLRALEGLPPLDDKEIRYLPTMMAAANLYLINWCVSGYYHSAEANVYEYLAYLQHSIRLMKRIDEKREEILRMAKSI